MRLVVPAPAKVNLFLSVGPRDGRGYHPIRTIFQAIGLYDTVTVETGVGETAIECDWPDLPAHNTLTRAHGFLQEIAQVPPLKITLEKQIMPQSGLGGGSSDAAALLRAIAELVPGGATSLELQRIAAAVGADVPFFLTGGRAIGEGYGERLTPLEDSPAQWLLVLRPRAGAGTAEMYRKLDGMAYEWSPLPGSDVLYNDFERVAGCESLELLERLIAAGARDAGLTGSGSAVFGRFNTEEEAVVASRHIDPEGLAGAWVAPTLSRSDSLRIERLP